MTDKQKSFAREYPIDCNITQAAIRAGYSKKTAYSIGQRLLKNVEVQKLISEKMEQIESEKIADAEEVMTYLTSVLRGQSEAEIVVVEGCGDGCSQAVNIKKAPDEKEKLKAAELLGKRFGLFKENLKVTGAVPVVISGEDDLEE